MSDVPETYDLDAFKAYMLGELEATAGVLGWTPAAHDAYAKAARRAIRALGKLNTVDCAAADLELAGRVEIWRGVRAETSTDHNFSADGGQYSREAVYAHAKLEFDSAIKAAQAAGLYLDDSMVRDSMVLQNCQRW